jgi:ATP/ADP translocase
MDGVNNFYPLFGLEYNVVLIVLGHIDKYFSNLRKKLVHGMDVRETSLKGMMNTSVLLGLKICGIYRWINKFVVYDHPLPKGESRKKKVYLYSNFMQIFESSLLGT